MAANKSDSFEGFLPDVSPRPCSTTAPRRRVVGQLLGPSCAGTSTGEDTASEADEGPGGETDQKPPAAEISQRSTGNQEVVQNIPTAGGLQLWHLLQEENIRLHRRVSEMEAFLKDHGLIWVGTGQVPDLEGWRRERPTSPDLDNILCAIHTLNLEITRENRRRVARTRGGAEFQATRSLHIAFYADGIVVGDGNVRPYSDRATKSFLSDLRDGFFPSEFKESNPDGLFIHAKDNRRKESSDALPDIRRGEGHGTVPFSGEGHRLGVRLNDELNGAGEERGEPRDMEGHTLSTEIPPKGATRESSVPCGQREESTSVEGREQHRLPPLGSDGEYVSGFHLSKEAVIRVRLAPTEFKIEFRVRFEETVKHLGHLIARRITECSKSGPWGHPWVQSSEFMANYKELPSGDALWSAFELRLPHLRNKNIDMEQTIEEAGLTPSAVVIFRRRKEGPLRGV